MANTENWRVNSRTGLSYPKTITGELHTVGYDEAVADYCIRLYEVPYKATPSSVSVMTSGTGSVDFTEVSTAPSTGQYYVDYDSAGRFGTGLVLFNAADDGKVVEVTYQGLGRAASAGAFGDTGDFTIGSDLTVSGDVILHPASIVYRTGSPVLGFITSQSGTADTLSPDVLRLWTGSGVISGGSTSQTIAHGITNLVSSQYLVGFNGHTYNAATEAGATAAYTQYAVGDNIIPLRFFADDTNITVLRGGTTGNIAFRCWIIYVGDYL